MTRFLHGRRIITSSEKITSKNVCKILDNSMTTHLINLGDIQYLYDYYKGKTEIENRTKEVRPEICNRISEGGARANEIVEFHVGFLTGKPIQYISSVSDERVSFNTARLNDMMRMAGKATLDKELVEWQMICGTGYRLILNNSDDNGSVPFSIYTLDPRNTFVIYSNDYKKEPIAGVYFVTDDDGNRTFTVYTRAEYFIIKNDVILKYGSHAIGRIPIIEYPRNNARLGVFENCLSLLDALSNLDSNRLDSVEQFVSSLLIVYNAEFDEGTTANQIRQSGMVYLKSNNGENKADIKQIADTLNQTEVQTLKNDIIQTINEIAGVPSQGNGASSDSSNNGAVILKNGWQSAETKAQDFESMFKRPETEMLKIVSVLCEGLSDLRFNPSDIDVKFTRRSFEDILSKSQTLTTLLASKYVHPKCAYEASGLFIDTEDAWNQGKEWQDEQDKKEKSTVETQTVMGGDDGEKPASN